MPITTSVLGTQKKGGKSSNQFLITFWPGFFKKNSAQLVAALDNSFCAVFTRKKYPSFIPSKMAGSVLHKNRESRFCLIFFQKIFFGHSWYCLKKYHSL